MNKIIIIAGLLFTCLTTYGQVGGRRSFEFMNVPSSARAAGLGGVNVSLYNEDINLLYNNPAAVGDSLGGYVSFNYLSYFADVNAVSFVYKHDFDKWGSWYIGTHHLGYGDIDSYDDTGAALGDFSAGETVFYIGKSHQIGSFTMGATLKYINSSIDAYSANALAMDLGGVFKHPTLNLTAGLVFKNIGVVFSDYTETADSRLPFDLQAGVSFKPEHMPFRFSFTGYNLARENDIYYGGADEDAPGTFDKVFRHVVVGAELLISKNLNFRFGYNHLIREELKLEDGAHGAGFSYGLMFRIKAFEFAYSRGGYHAAGASNSFTITANTNLFLRKGKI
ncbi:type IX secretion system protein PorQ [Fulvivirga maritima]|uniref:type IX secretion system protein PorQ n=1 Tax=Fulvivirga maritima TaxID=2904247 RepID=UPI001F3241C7|nr:type IX secretion system protein PorQ [Fulvivirga maritima]UII29032.1 type IX secretion system protein PorQ [Fulvivirga maritima]